MTPWDNWITQYNNSDIQLHVDVVKRIMEMIDKDTTPFHNGYFPDLHTPHGIIWKAYQDAGEEKPTRFMLQWVSEIISNFHVRGKEFEKYMVCLR